MKRMFGVLAVLGSCLVAGSAWASPTGSFAVSGSMTFNDTSISFAGNTIAAPSGGYASSVPALNGTGATVSGISFPPDPLGSTFAPQSFLSFNADPTLATLLVDFIAAGISPSADCAAAAAAGQVCSPSGTPYDFQNTFGPPGSTLTFDLSGVTSDGTADWTGIFTSQFSSYYQSEVAAAATGSVTTTYSANFVVTPNAVTGPSTGVPEPASLVYLLTALGGLAGAQRWRSWQKRA
jgi:hypothetical protein